MNRKNARRESGRRSASRGSATTTGHAQEMQSLIREGSSYADVLTRIHAARSSPADVAPLPRSAESRSGRIER